MKEQLQLIDKFGRIHDYLRISLIERCNLRCVYCMPEEGIVLRDKSEFMRPEEIIEIAKEFVSLGINKIRLTGGEPLLRKGADLVIRELSKLPVELTLTTNGVLIDKYLDLLVDSGVKSVNVSLDSLVPERFKEITRRDQFDRVMKNIDLLNQAEMEVKINVVLIKGQNEDEIIDFISWSQENDLHVRFIEFMPFDGNNWSSDQKISEHEILSEAEEFFGKENVESLPVKPHSTERKFKVKGTKGSFGVISTVTNPFCDSCNRIRLTADGKIKNCLFSEDESDLLSALRNGEEIRPIILKTTLSKAKARGGYSEFTNETASRMENRSMVKIGG